MRYCLFALLLLSVSIGACSLLKSGEISPRPDDAVIRGVNYIGVTVSDLEKSTRLYGDVGNLQAVDDSVISDSKVFAALTGSEDSRVVTRLMRGSNAQIRFMQFESPSPAALQSPRVEVNGPGYAHIAIQAKQEMQPYQRFLQAGGTPVGLNGELTSLHPLNPVQYAYARDEDEIMFEFEHVDISRLDLPEPPKNDYRIRHIAIATADYERAVAFYSVLLEQENPRRLGRWFNLSGDGFDNVSGYEETELKMAFFQVRNIELEIAQYMNPASGPAGKARPIDARGHNMIMFDVADMAAAQKQVLAAGGTLVNEPQAFEGGTVMFARDPDQNLIGFQKIAASSVFSSQNFDGDGS